MKLILVIESKTRFNWKTLAKPFFGSVYNLCLVFNASLHYRIVRVRVTLRVDVEKYSGKEKLVNHVNYKNILMVENVTKYVLY